MAKVGETAAGSAAGAAATRRTSSVAKNPPIPPLRTFSTETIVQPVPSSSATAEWASSALRASTVTRPLLRSITG